MKKIFTLALCALGFMTVNAQELLDGNKFQDNWSVGLNAGVSQSLSHPYSIGDNIRPVVGVEVFKKFTPVFKLGFDVDFGINTTNNHGVRGVRTAFDHSNLSLLGGLNFMNMFGGYKGEPRLFEIEAIGGIGWGHMFTNYNVDGYDYNFMTSKFGINFNFNLGKDKAWTVALKPGIAFNIEGRDAYNDNVKYNSQAACFQLMAGVAYNFKGSNGAHHFTYTRAYNQAEVDELNGRVNDLRSDLNDKQKALDKANARIVKLAKALKDCENKEPERIVTVTKVTEKTNSMESIVTFRQGKVTIDASQRPNVERIATYLKNHKSATVDIKGYASPEGNAELNARLAQQRADAVKTMLVNKYGIKADRISSEGQGVGNMFSEPDWNRVSICTLVEK